MEKIHIKDIGKSLMLPIAIFPLAAILLGIGYSLERIHELYFLSYILKSIGNIIINNMPLFFSIGISYGLDKNKSSLSAINGMISFFVVMILLSKSNSFAVQNDLIIGTRDAFTNINNQFIGILCGVIAHYVTELSKNIKINIPMLSSLLCIVCMIVVSSVLYYVWPAIYNVLIVCGQYIYNLGPLGAGIYGFLNRLLLPLGIHHILNSMFWFDVIGINDIGNFWTSKGVLGVTGMYQAGFFPIMMFAMPAVALVFYNTAYPANKKKILPFLISTVIASVFSGITEPIELTFMYISPILYVIHAILCGLTLYIVATFKWIAGFSFSAGIIDYILSFSMPLANKPYMLIVIGPIVFIIYYMIFKFLILKFDIKTIGRNPIKDDVASLSYSRKELNEIVKNIIMVCGGFNNVIKVETCLTRLRIQLKDVSKLNMEKADTKAIEYNLFDNEVQFVYGYQVDFIYDLLECYELNE